jgi:hypothetical protein
LVLLDANPRRHFRTQKIRAVIVNGRYLGREQLDAMLVASSSGKIDPTAVDTISC